MLFKQLADQCNILIPIIVPPAVGFVDCPE